MDPHNHSNPSSSTSRAFPPFKDWKPMAPIVLPNKPLPRGNRSSRSKSRSRSRSYELEPGERYDARSRRSPPRSTIGRRDRSFSPDRPGSGRRERDRDWDRDRDRDRDRARDGVVVRAGERSRQNSGVPRREGSPGKGSSVPQAIEVFTKALHTTLTSISSHALAQSHRDRLTTFSPDPATLEEVTQRVTTLERALDQRLAEVHKAFAEVIKRTISKPGVATGDTSALEVEGVRERVEKLERELVRVVRRGIPPPPERSPPPPPPPPDDRVSTSTSRAKGVEPDPDKRSRARETINDLLKRVDNLEAFKDVTESRLDDLQDQTLELEGEEPVIRSWDDLQNRRDPNGKLRGVIVKPALVVEEGELVTDGGDGDGWDDFERERNPDRGMEVDEVSIVEVEKPTQTGAEVSSSAVEVAEGAVVKHVSTGVVTTSNTIPVSIAQDNGKTDRLEKEVVALRGEIESLKSAREQWVKEATESAASKMREEYSKIVSEQISSLMKKAAQVQAIQPVVPQALSTIQNSPSNSPIIPPVVVNPRARTVSPRTGSVSSQGGQIVQWNGMPPPGVVQNPNGASSPNNSIHNNTPPMGYTTQHGQPPPPPHPYHGGYSPYIPLSQPGPGPPPGPGPGPGPVQYGESPYSRAIPPHLMPYPTSFTPHGDYDIASIQSGGGALPYGPGPNQDYHAHGQMGHVYEYGNGTPRNGSVNGGIGPGQGPDGAVDRWTPGQGQ